MYTPSSANTFRTMAGIAAWESFGEGELPISGPVVIRTTFFLRRPQRLKKRKGVVHSLKPDLDNLDKALRDGLTDASVFTDDCIIWKGESCKYYADPDASPRAEVTIEFDPKEATDGVSGKD